MSFPYEFSKKSGDYDFFSPIINSTGNAMIVAAGGISLAAISYLVLNALGFSTLGTTLATAVPVTIGAFGIIGAVVGASISIAMCIAIVKAFRR